MKISPIFHLLYSIPGLAGRLTPPPPLGKIMCTSLNEATKNMYPCISKLNPCYMSNQIGIKRNNLVESSDIWCNFLNNGNENKNKFFSPGND